jgi:hypothetical protein
MTKKNGLTDLHVASTIKRVNNMTPHELHTLAKPHGIDDKTLSKPEVINNIQTREGNFIVLLRPIVVAARV